MHEHSLVRTLLEQADVLRREHHADRIAAIRVTVGQFSGVEPDLFRLAFERLTENTPADGANLHIEQVALAAKCDECETEFIVERFRFECPDCQSSVLKIVRGEDLVLESVTLDQTESSNEQANCRRKA